MKCFYGIALLAAAIGISAQGNSYTTVDVWASCTDSTAGTDTVTSTVVATTCPLCMNNGGMQTHYTTYTTIWQTMCSTGLTPATYTITETCTGATPTWSQDPTYIPPGYTTTQVVCAVCGGNGPQTITMTVPCTDNSQTWYAPTTHYPPTNTWNPPMTGSATYTTTTVCPGSTMCHHTTSTTTSVWSTRSSVMPYTTGGAMPAPTAWGGLLRGAAAAAALGAVVL